MPISWSCKKQTAVSDSSTEDEVISLDAGVRMDGNPPPSARVHGTLSLTCWNQKQVGHNVLVEDKEAVIKMIVQDWSPKTTEILIGCLIASILRKPFKVQYVNTAQQIADVFVSARALGAVDTPVWFSDTSNALLQPLCGRCIFVSTETCRRDQGDAQRASLGKIKAFTWTLNVF